MHQRVGTPQGSIVNVHAWVLITGAAIRAGNGMKCLILLHVSGGHATMLADSLLRRRMMNRPNNALHTYPCWRHAFFRAQKVRLSVAGR